MKKHITVIEGDGIGPEVTAQAVQVLEAVAERFGHEFEYEYRKNRVRHRYHQNITISL